MGQDKSPCRKSAAPSGGGGCWGHTELLTSRLFRWQSQDMCFTEMICQKKTNICLVDSEIISTLSGTRGSSGSRKSLEKPACGLIFSRFKNQAEYGPCWILKRDIDLHSVCVVSPLDTCSWTNYRSVEKYLVAIGELKWNRWYENDPGTLTTRLQAWTWKCSRLVVSDSLWPHGL